MDIILRRKMTPQQASVLNSNSLSSLRFNEILAQSGSITGANIKRQQGNAGSY
ncbi:MAG: hypothetical protein ACP5MB_06385 [bacterium]